MLSARSLDGFACIGMVDERGTLGPRCARGSRRSCPSGILSRPLHLERFDHCSSACAITPGHSCANTPVSAASAQLDASGEREVLHLCSWVQLVLCLQGARGALVACSPHALPFSLSLSLALSFSLSLALSLSLSL